MSGSDKASALQVIKDKIEEVLQVDPHRIDTEVPLSVYGIDSAFMAMILDDLEDHFSHRFPTDVLEGNPSADELASRVVAEYSASA
ncbi:acyl carrier protein [Kocuria rhizophila]|uniref:acyl carrier protein n=1 Tax=Kocuria rhizophila TaxID=72000 RepID=UPI0011A5D93F|nr:acyl carrier protein [Kocuria rhizophila]